MPCPKTQHLLQEYFADDLAPLAREELDKHFVDCPDCNAELESLLLAKGRMEQWQDQRVPHWDRGLDLFKREHRASNQHGGFWNRWQWFPTAASFAMLSVLLLNISFVSDEQGFAISFSGSQSSQLNLDDFEERQRAEMDQLVLRMEDRQDSNNVRLMQALLEQNQQATAENFEQIYAYFEPGLTL